MHWKDDDANPNCPAAMDAQGNIEENCLTLIVKNLNMTYT